MSIILAIRALRRNPWFAATAVLTIALGIGATASMFSVVNRVLLAPLPYDNPDRLVWIATWNAERGQYSKSSGYDFNIWQQRTEIFEAVEAFWDRAYTVTGTVRPEGLVGWQFTPGLFAMLGAPPAMGRTFTRADGAAGRDNLVVLSDALWRRRFDARSDVVGTAVELDGRPYTITGVMPASFTHPYPIAQLWTPAALSSSALEDRKQRSYRVVARLREGVTRERAEIELRAVADRLAREHPDSHEGFSVSVRPLRDFYVGDVRQLLWVLQATAGVLLLIAVSNVASLILVRETGRQRETAVRLALGAGRLDLFRQHLGEGLLLAGLGAAGGLLIASWGSQVLPVLLATRLQNTALPGTPAWIDARVLLATAAAALAVSLLFGITPLLRPADGLSNSLRGSRGATGDRRTRLARHAIVTAQIALSVLLLVGAGLLVRSFARLQDRSFGFDTDHVVTAQLLLPRDRYASQQQSGAFLDQLVSSVGALPGVESAAAVNTLPLTGFNALRPHNLPGQPPQTRLAEFRIVTPAYFRTMAIPIRRGRVFDERDGTGSPGVVVVNETAARRLWPGADPVGETLMVPDFGEFAPRRVIGVVGDTRHHDLAKDPEAEIYRPASQAYWPFFGLVVRTQSTAEGLERTLRDAAGRVDSTVPISAVRSLGSLADSTWAWRRSSMVLLGAFAALACVLAFVGVYGVMAFGVTERSREIGVRVALGARPADVARTILVQATWLTGAGTVCGLVLAALAGGTLSALLFGITPLDPPTFLIVTVIAIVAGLLATAIPALTAIRVDPTAALKQE
jgi:putative ABC transport system permease protein